MQSNQQTAQVTATSQRVLQRLPGRGYLIVQNQDAAGVLAVVIGRQGSGGSAGLQVLPGQSWEPVNPPEDDVYLSGSGFAGSFMSVEVIEGVNGEKN